MIGDQEIAGRFNCGLGRRAATLLVGGGNEPLYLPPRGRQPAMIRYTRDYARSALHELAHWTLASARRRTLVDYGYGYVAPPRGPADQAAFFDSELRVQALESLFCRACGLDFHVSADNIGAGNIGAEAGAFAERVDNAAERLSQSGLPGSAARIMEDLGQLAGANA